ALEGIVREQLDRVQLAPVAGRALRAFTAQGRHEELVDAALAGLLRALDDNRDDLHHRFGQKSPWWLPGAVEDRIFDRLLDGAELGRRLAYAIVSAGTRVRDDPALALMVDNGAETAVRYVVERFDGEIATLVTGTIARWDGQETARRLELLLGADLQYIRING